jgi:hypothetical protein
MRAAVLFAGLAVLLAACTPTGEKVCQEKGLQPGTEAYKQCTDAEYQKTLNRVYSNAYRPSGK